MSRPLSLPPPRVHTLGFTDAGNIRLTPLQKYGAAGEDGHLVTMAEKMQPALLLTAHPVKQERKRKPEAEMAATKKALDKERSQTRVIIGAAFEWWRQLEHVKGLKSDAEVSLFLLDRK